MSHRIAIIEDEQPIRELYRIKLEADGHQVVTAKDGEEGLALLKDHRPTLMLLDIMMPKMDGLALLAAADEHKLRPRATIILTNLALEDARQQAAPYKVDGIFVKVETTPVQVANHVRVVLEQL
jgi:CheY-like chemotaxis protein